VRDDIEEAADLLPTRLMVIDVCINTKGEVVKVYAGDYGQEFKAALPLSRKIYMTRFDRADITIMSRPPSWDRTLSSAIYHGLLASDLAVKDDGIIILVASCINGWALKEDLEMEQVPGPDLYRMSTEELAYSLVRRRGDFSVRVVSIAFPHKRVLENKRVFLVSERISDIEAKEFGFAFSTKSFPEALSKALEEKGKNATIATNFPGKEWSEFRVMPWVD